MDNKDLPNDADGDVIRGLIEKGFDFSQEYMIDFNVDFKKWPPSSEAIAALESEYPDTEIYEDSESEDRYVFFSVKNKLSYDLVVETQTKATALVSKYGGFCESWGILH